MGICDPAAAPTVKTGMAAKLESWDRTVTCAAAGRLAWVRTQWDTIQALGSPRHYVTWDLLLWNPHFLWLSKVHAWLFRHCMVPSGGMAKQDITKTLLAFNAKAFPARRNPALPFSSQCRTQFYSGSGRKPRFGEGNLVPLVGTRIDLWDNPILWKIQDS